MKSAKDLPAADCEDDRKGDPFAIRNSKAENDPQRKQEYPQIRDDVQRARDVEEEGEVDAFAARNLSIPEVLDRHALKDENQLDGQTEKTDHDQAQFDPPLEIRSGEDAVVEEENRHFDHAETNAVTDGEDVDALPPTPAMRTDLT